MTHESIQHPDSHEFNGRPLLEAKMAAELDFYKRAYARACDDLRSIYERVEAGEPVYFVRRDGSCLYLKEAEP